eukprot:1204446-Amphidinium_carterae.1
MGKICEHERFFKTQGPTREPKQLTDTVKMASLETMFPVESHLRLNHSRITDSHPEWVKLEFGSGAGKTFAACPNIWQ